MNPPTTCFHPIAHRWLPLLQKRKLSRQRDTLLSLKARYAAQEAKAGEENGKLTEQYRRVTEQFKDLQVCNMGCRGGAAVRSL